MTFVLLSICQATNNVKLPVTCTTCKMSQTEVRPSVYENRDELHKAQRIIIKIGSAVLTREDQSGLAFARLASIVEQVSDLRNAGKDVIIVTSGAVALGKQKINTEIKLSQSMRQTIRQLTTESTSNSQSTIPSVRFAASIGQRILIDLYGIMFTQYGVTITQVLVTKSDFHNQIRRTNLRYTIEECFGQSVVPIVNTNDAIVSPMMPDDPDIIIEPETGPKEVT